MRLISETEIQEMFGFSRNKTRRLFHTPGFKGFMIGKDAFITEDNFERWLKSLAGSRFKVRYGGKKDEKMQKM